MNFDIVEVLTRAWKITWKYKVLWIFGMLASCGRRSSSGNSSNNRTNTSASNGQFPSNGPFTGQMMKQMEAAFERVGHWFAEHPWVIVALILLFIFILILQIFLSTVGSVGLIRGAYQAETGVEKIQFGSLFSESLRYFWRVIGLGLTIFLPIILAIIALFILLTITFAGAAKASASGSGAAGVILLFIGFCCCLIPFIVVLGLYYTQSLRALVLEDLGVFASLSRGWEVFKKNIGGLLFTAVIIFIINLLIGLIIAIPVYIAMAPVLINLLQGNIDSWRPFIIAGTIVLCYSPIAWFLSGILVTYTETIWTLIFMRATQPKENVPVTLPANA